jgi:hypothetical protein
MTYYDMEEGNYPSEKRQENENEFVADEWSVEKRETDIF